MKAYFVISALALSFAVICGSASANAATVNAPAASAKTAETWLDLPQQDLVYLELSQGVVVLQLADQFAPAHSQRFRQLVKSKFYDGLTFYRVIDQYVLQAGLPEGESHPSGKAQQWPAIKAEFTWPVRNTDPYFLIEKNDVYAKETGFNQGFPVGREGNEEWLLNCANMISMARDPAPDTGTTDFAIMQGQAPRHLDRNMSMFARVVYGGEWLNLMPRGDRNIDSGVIEKAAARGVIVKATMGNELAQNKQLPLQMMNTQSSEFEEKIAKHRARDGEFFHYKGLGKVDICYQQVPVRLRPVTASAAKTQN